MCRFIRLCVFLWTSNRVWLVRIHLSVCVCMSVCIPPSHPPDPRCKCASADKEPAGIQRSANTVCTTLNTHTGNCRFAAGKMYLYCSKLCAPHWTHTLNTAHWTLHNEHRTHTLETVNIYCRKNFLHRTEYTPSEHHVQHTKLTYCILCWTLNIYCRTNCTYCTLPSAHHVQHNEHKKLQRLNTVNNSKLPLSP